MKILIMCGGYGSRMGKISKNIPKPLVDIDGLPILHHKINNYYKQGYSKFILAVGYKKELIINYINKTDFLIKFNNIYINDLLYIVILFH